MAVFAFDINATAAKHYEILQTAWLAVMQPRLPPKYAGTLFYTRQGLCNGSSALDMRERVGEELVDVLCNEG